MSSKQASQTMSFPRCKFFLGSDPWLGQCEFDRLLTKNVPHIFEKIFFFLDNESFKNCRDVCQAWKVLFASKRYRKKEKEIYQDERCLLLVSKDGNAPEVKRLLMRGVSPNFKDRQGMTPLLAAARKGDKDMITMLLDRGALPNAIDKRGKTPLVVAVFHQHKDVAKLLLSRGADPNIGKYYGRITLTWAVKRSDIETVQQCLDGGADPNMIDNKSEKPLLAIALETEPRCGSGLWIAHHDVIHLLLERGADINETDDIGRYKCILEQYVEMRKVFRV